MKPETIPNRDPYCNARATFENKSAGGSMTSSTTSVATGASSTTSVATGASSTTSVATRASSTTSVATGSSSTTSVATGASSTTSVATGAAGLPVDQLERIEFTSTPFASALA